MITLLELLCWIYRVNFNGPYLQQQPHCEHKDESYRKGRQLRRRPQ
jgi:hypothetical protein